MQNNSLEKLKEEVSMAHRKLIASSDEDINENLVRYIDLKEKYFKVLRGIKE